MSVPAQVPISGPYIANGVTTQSAYKFYLLFATDMQVFVGGQKKTLNTDYTVTGVGNSQGGNVVFISAPANGLEVLIKRATHYTRQTDYADNGDLLADVVNDDFDRIWLALQEINASFSSSISKPVGGNWDAQSLRITNVSDGTQPQDVATLNQLNVVNDSAGQSAKAAANSATAAKTSENNSASSQQAAVASASAASVSAGNSSDSANLAQKWASNPVGTEVTAGKYSAFHYASKAGDSAAAASSSATNAAASATNASNSATAASQSATSAKSDADRAQSANPDNQLKKANNLSDVADKPASLSNLGGLPLAGGTMTGELIVNKRVYFNGDDQSHAVNVNSTNTKLSLTGYYQAFSNYYNDVIRAKTADIGGTNELVLQFVGVPGQKYGAFLNVSDSSFEFRSNGTGYSPNGWTSTSDQRIKDKVTQVENALAAVLSFRGCTWEYKNNKGAAPWQKPVPGAGLIAQDVEKWCPSAISLGDMPQQFQDGTVVEQVKSLNTLGVSAAYHTEAIKTLFGLIKLLAESPDGARAKIAEIEAVKAPT